KAITEWLPNEMIIHMAELAAKADQASLCRVSKLLYDLCFPVLNRTVELRYDADYDTTSTFLFALIDDPAQAGAIRSFKVQYMRDGEAWLLKEAFVESIPLMLGLENLSLYPFLLDRASTEALLQHCTFPRLASCDIGPEPYILGMDAADTRLCVQNVSHHDVAEEDTVGPPSTRIPLPNLRYFAGPACFIPVISGPTLSEA
ncbi:hypothetical protein FB451DRAFT_1221203, partial [Mycena latifolia]